MGRLEWRKGVVGLIEACTRLWTDGGKFRLTLIGGDTDFAPLNCTIGDLIRRRFGQWIDRGNLNLPGPVPYTEVREHVRRAWAATIPSHWENFPNTCIEAMAEAQVPLVSRQGGQAEMVAQDGANGFIFDWETPGDLERQLDRVLKLERSERLEIADRAQQRIRALCEPQRVLPQRLEHFERVISGQKPRRVFPIVAPPCETVSVAPERDRYQADLLSVVIPFYNLGQYIDETLASVEAASYRPLEIVLVNDGSTDACSLAKLKEIEARHLPHLRVVHTENQGLASARDNGVAVARGAFIAFVDADDRITPGFYALAIDVLRRYENVGYVSSWVRYFDESRGIWPAWNAEFPYLLGHNMSCVLSVVRRSAYEHSGGHDPAFAYALEDYAAWMRMVATGYAGVSLCQPLVEYRIRPGSMLRSTHDDQLLYLHDLLAQRHPEAYRQWGAELYNLLNANGPSHIWNNPAEIFSGGTQLVTLHKRVEELEEAKAWLRSQCRAKDDVIEELRAWARKVEETRARHENETRRAPSELETHGTAGRLRTLRRRLGRALRRVGIWHDGQNS